MVVNADRTIKKPTLLPMKYELWGSKQYIWKLGEDFLGKIVAIGGGNLAELETLSIDREVVELTGKTQPKALFIPTASYDSVDYWAAFQKVYGKELGCETSVLYLLGIEQSSDDMDAQIQASHLIYVGGGNTLKMMRRWRKLGVDRMIERAYSKGAVLAGVSAGAICWFNYGHSDSMSFYNPNSWSYIRVKGMGLIEAFACPHFNGETNGARREQDFMQMVQKVGGPGLAIDNHCALEVVDSGLRVITSQPGAAGYLVNRSRGRVTVEKIPQRQEFAPISSFLNRQA